MLLCLVDMLLSNLSEETLVLDFLVERVILTAVGNILELRLVLLDLSVALCDADLVLSDELGVFLYHLRNARSLCLELIDEYNKSITESKHNITECDAQIEKYKAQLENIANSREYDSLNKEIENQGYVRQIAEKIIHETKERILEKKSELETVKERVSIKSEDLKAKQQELATIVEATSKDEEKLRTNRDACAAKIDARTMSAYDRIRESSNNHLAVVSVFNGDSCGGCFNTIAPQRLIDIASNRKMIICEYCGRILVNPDFE